MKRLFSFFRSMRFGMVLLVLVMACSLAGSLIPQGESQMTYVRAYGASPAKILIELGLTDIFHTWYFTALEILLCVNLILCSVVRFPRTRKLFRELKEKTAAEAPDQTLDPGQGEKIREVLRRSRFKLSGEVFAKNSLGAYGSFLTHLSILVILLFGGLVLATPTIEDRTVMPGETLTLENGTKITCLTFHIENESGQLDYASRLRAESADGSQTVEKEIRVNEPLTFGGTKIYQQTYGTAGQVKIVNAANGAEETVYLTEPCFLSIDSRNGVSFQALYPAFIQEEDGSYTLITSTSGGYPDPVYSVQSISDGASTSVLVFPGETIRNGDISFTFLQPVEYPGLRIKQVSTLLYAGLYTGFGMMIVALYLCFFHIPVCVRVTEEGYGIHSPKPQEELKLRIQIALGGNGEKNEEEKEA